MITARDQDKTTLCIALFNRELHKAGICPANHSVSYSCGWFYLDDQRPRHRPELTAEADELLQSGRFHVLYWPQGNTYVLGDYNEED